MIGVELGDAATGRARADLAAEAATEHEGVIVMHGGPDANVLRLLPPLVIDARPGPRDRRPGARPRARVRDRRGRGAEAIGRGVRVPAV